MSKSILITGAGSGLGKGSALGLAAQGHKVHAGVEIWPQVTALQEEARRCEVDLEVIKLDLLSEVDCRRAQQLDIDILVNNAGTGETGPIAEIPVELVRRVFDVNVFGTLAFTQPFARRFAERGRGKIVFLSSMAGVSTYPFLCPYNASKHALEAIAQCMRDELKDHGVQVCTINPGPYRTGFNDRMYDSVDQWYDVERNFTEPGPIREIQQGVAAEGGQFDPQAMIDLMVATIPAESHKFRTMLPESIEEWCKDYQQRMWTETI